MGIKDILLKSIREQESKLLEMPDVVFDALEIVMDDISSNRTTGKAKPNALSNYNYANPINLIPSNHYGACHEVLITLCYDKDNLENRILESLDHASQLCPGQCRRIYFITTQWYSSVINKLSGYTDIVRKSGVEINFIYTAKKGVVLMPV